MARRSVAQDLLPADGMPEEPESTEGKVQMSYGGNWAKFRTPPEAGDKVFLLIQGEITKAGEGTRKKGGIYHFATVVGDAQVLSQRQVATILTT